MINNLTSINPIVFKQLEINNSPILRRIFVCLRFCCVERIAGYVTEATRPKTDKKASKVDGLFVSRCLIIGFILIHSLTACQAKKTPLETAQLFWSAIAENRLDLAKKQCSSQSQKIPSSGNDKLKNINLNYGKIVIEGVHASVETQFKSSTGKKLSFTTFLINENESWKIDCQRSTTAFNGSQVFEYFFNELNDLGKSLNEELQQQLPLIEKEVETFGQQLKQQLDTFKEELKKLFPSKKQQKPYQDTI